WVENVSDLGSLESKFSSFGWSVARCDGHDFRMIAQTLNDMRSAQDRPKILIADTIKAKGVSFMQSTSAGLPERLYPYHSGAVAPTIYRQAVEEIRSRLNAALKKIKQRALNMQRIPAVPVAVGVQTGGLRHELLGVYSKALASCGAKNRNLVVLSADLAKDCGLLEFERKFPDRFVECGIAEQDMVSQAGGLALKGCLPVVHSFASFLASRANEQIYNNATEAKRIIYTGTLAGLLPATPGHSHQAIHDISVLRAVPGLTLIQPADAAQLKRALSWAVSANTGSTYLRICSVPVLSPLNTSFDGQLSRGRGTIALKGDDALIITYGPVMLAEACGAAQLLRSHNRVSAAVMNLPWLNAIDEKWFQQIASFYRYVITIDDHSIEGGQGQMIAAACSRIGLGLRLLTLGISGIPACGQKAEVLRAHCLDGESIAEAIAVFVKT
ncbi:MAG: transketolase C-terminal domain-containing protein, partial [Candidatus Omnitrophota bacterium]